jgi:hypothetical protein
MVIIYSLSSAPIGEHGPVVGSTHGSVHHSVVAVTGDPDAGARLTSSIEHVVLYEGLGAIGLFAWGSLTLVPIGGRWQVMSRLALRFSLPMAIGLASLYGSLDEWHQSWVDGRCASIGDVAWDVFGASAGAVAGSILRSMRSVDGRIRRWITAV